MLEDELYQKHVRSWLLKQGVFIQRIDYPRIPDIYTAHPELGVVWYEMKCINAPSRGRIKPAWRPGQLSWIREQSRHGVDNVRLLLFYCGALYLLRPKEFYEKEELDGQRIV